MWVSHTSWNTTNNVRPLYLGTELCGKLTPDTVSRQNHECLGFEPGFILQFIPVCCLGSLLSTVWFFYITAKLSLQYAYPRHRYLNLLLSNSCHYSLIVDSSLTSGHHILLLATSSARCRK